MRKNKIILIFIAIFLVATLNFMSAQLTGIQYPQCCSLAKNGAQCVAVPASECASNFAPTSCDNVPSCQKGVCVNIQSGEGVKRPPTSICENSGGLSKPEPIHKILEGELGF